ncbi:MAG: hypothetical protein II194_07855 [Bacteroidales bacterium]|nr:hypothetical protein [Bacteroidales bacterium]
MKITAQQYEFALARIEELLPIVNEQTSASDRNVVELALLSEIVIEYETVNYPIEKPSITASAMLGL